MRAPMPPGGCADKHHARHSFKSQSTSGRAAQHRIQTPPSPTSAACAGIETRGSRAELNRGGRRLSPRRKRRAKTRRPDCRGRLRAVA
ncbi:unnamed protein product [Lampetra planeri]